MSTNSQFPSAAEPLGSNLGDRANEIGSSAGQKANEVARAAADEVSSQRGNAASGLESAASTLHSKADRLPGGEKVSKFAHSAADKLSSTADYVRDADMARIRGDVERVVRNNPGPSLLAAAVVGFLVARTLSHRA